MTFLEFYSLDATALVVIILVSIITFMTVSYIDRESNKEEKISFNFILIMSVLMGIISSFAYSYFTIEDDVIMTDNYL